MVGGHELKFRGGTLGGRTFSDSENWVDPIVGINGRIDLGAKTYFNGWAVVGGFGAGSDSMWDAMGALGYKFSDRFSTLAGYRAVSVDYENDGFVYDVVQSGSSGGALHVLTDHIDALAEKETGDRKKGDGDSGPKYYMGTADSWPG